MIISNKIEASSNSTQQKILRLNERRIRIRYTVTPMALLLASICGCSSNDNADANLVGLDVPFSIIAEGDLPNSDSVLQDVKRTEIYRTQQQLDAATGLFITDLPVFTVDFTTNQTVLVTLGIQSNIGSSFRVDGVFDYEEYVELHVTYEATGPGCLQLGAVNHPYKLVELNSRKIVVINERFELQECASQ